MGLCRVVGALKPLEFVCVPDPNGSRAIQVDIAVE